MISIIPLTALGQINVGDVLLIRRTNEFIAPVTVKEALNAGSNFEEIVISKSRNVYFVTSMFLDGTSWMKECANLVDGKMYSIGNSMHDFSTYEQRLVRP